MRRRAVRRPLEAVWLQRSQPVPAAKGATALFCRHRRYWGVGFNPMRAQKRRTSDYVFLAAALIVTLLLLLWAFNP